jgi:hypothetical protein
MNLAQQFQALANAWTQHCQRVRFSSQLEHYLDHPAYHQLVALGPPAIPFIMERYQADPLPWGFVLQAITGIPMIADPNDFSPAEVKQNWLRWWHEQPPRPPTEAPEPAESHTAP